MKTLPAYLLLGALSATAESSTEFDHLRTSVFSQSGQNGVAGLIDTVQITVFFDDVELGAQGPADPVPLFEDLSLTLTDVGSTFLATAASDPDFERAVAFLTNGVPDSVRTAVSFDGDTAFLENGECYALFGAGSCARGIDFAGSSIESIELRLDQLVLSSPGTDPNADGNWTDIDYRFTVAVHAVPLPATLILFAGALGGLSSVATRRHGRPHGE